MNLRSVARHNAVPVPSGRTLAFLAFFLRVGLALALLNHGLMGFHALAQAGSGGGVYLAVYQQVSNMVPGSAPLLGYLPYLEMATGLALLLGFCTTAAAMVAAVIALVYPFMQTSSLMTGGLNFTRNGPFAFEVQSLMFGGTATLIHIACVLWLSPVASNPWSLDALMFGGRRVGPYTPIEPASEIRDDPVTTDPAKLTREFDPEPAS